MIWLAAISINTRREGRGANKQEKRGKYSANAYGSACVTTCVGEPYAAKWQPTGGERLTKIEWEPEREGKTEEWLHGTERGKRGGRKSVCELERERGREGFETRSSVAELSERYVSHRADETWHTLAIAHSSLHQSCSAAESVPLSHFLESGIDYVGSMLAISIFSCGERGDKAIESGFHFHHGWGWNQKLISHCDSLSFHFPSLFHSACVSRRFFIHTWNSFQHTHTHTQLSVVHSLEEPRLEEGINKARYSSPSLPHTLTQTHTLFLSLSHTHTGACRTYKPHTHKEMCRLTHWNTFRYIHI